MSRSALFHGTAHWFRPGETVDPTVPATGIIRHAAAWGTAKMQVAATYGAHKAAQALQRPLFSPVYEVEPKSDPDSLRTHSKVQGSVGDPKGMRVKQLAGYAGFDGTVL